MDYIEMAILELEKVNGISAAFARDQYRRLKILAGQDATQQSEQADLLPCGHSSDNLGNFGGCNPMGSCIICDATISR